MRENVRLLEAKPIWVERIGLRKFSLFGTSLYLFILAISLMKVGARGIAPVIRSFSFLTHGINSLGFGWSAAYFIMSGSPVAAAALTFFDAGALDKIGTFMMITGSRLGASFIVLFVGLLYVLRGHDRATSLSMGLLSLCVTATTYLPGLCLGLFLLNTGLLDSLQLKSGLLLRSAIDLMVEPAADLMTNHFPNWFVFTTGIGIIFISFNLFDKCLPQTTLKESQFGWMSRVVYKPGVMFILGALVTLFSMSVSLSLSLLVPLSTRGFVRRENMIPYIMGANITTFIDTLLAAVLLNNPDAFTIVFVEMVSITIISIIVLTTVYHRYQRATLNLVGWATASNRNLILIIMVLFFTPIILLLV